MLFRDAISIPAPPPRHRLFLSPSFFTALFSHLFIRSSLLSRNSSSLPSLPYTKYSFWKGLRMESAVAPPVGAALLLEGQGRAGQGFRLVAAVVQYVGLCRRGRSGQEGGRERRKRLWMKVKWWVGVRQKRGPMDAENRLYAVAPHSRWHSILGRGYRARMTHKQW